ncbi:MAG TPA: ABC transporter substrate-binding protein [Stellaceae bacterium]|nr:ABC transporter substrate-binding protein [Stellaceae bacterium]
MGLLRFVAVAAAAFAGVATAGEAAEPLDIHVGWVTPTAAPYPLALEKKDLLTHFGKTYTVDLTRVASTAAALTALATGELNINTLSYSSIPSAIQNAHLTDLRIIMDISQDGYPGYATGQFMVRKDSGINRVEDLKGKVLASLTVGSAVDMATRAMLRKHGLSDKTDVTFIEVPFANMKAVLIEKKADLITTNEPFVEDPELQAAARTLFTQRDAMGVTQLLVWGARADFINQHRAAMEDFIEDALRYTRYSMDPAHHDEMVGIAANFMKLPPKQVDYVFTHKDLFKDPNGMPDMKALQANIDLEKQLGFLKDSLDVGKYADFSLVNAAVSRLGKQ